MGAFSYTAQSQQVQKTGYRRCRSVLLVISVVVAWCLAIGGVAFTVYQAQIFRREMAEMKELIQKCEYMHGNDCVNIYSSNMSQ